METFDELITDINSNKNFCANNFIVSKIAIKSFFLEFKLLQKFLYFLSFSVLPNGNLELPLYSCNLYIFSKN